ncbi:hypothetical protein Ga0080559_TMP1693 [Salipiger profundus]|uniref:Uncharacterized protein n=1 Tax=Salipiger profundus TaxID=1229727 RepID=A0A1U7D2W8_9RHOB|nr:hypothetical protein Ga0080559_TMP1693 [Salipiger profundus]
MCCSGAILPSERDSAKHPRTGRAGSCPCAKAEPSRRPGLSASASAAA